MLRARGAYGDLDVLPEHGKELHQSANRETARPATHQVGNVRLFHPEEFTGLGLRSTAHLYGAIDLQGQIGLDLFLLRVRKIEIGEDVAAALDNGWGALAVGFFFIVAILVLPPLVVLLGVEQAFVNEFNVFLRRGDVFLGFLLESAPRIYRIQTPHRVHGPVRGDRVTGDNVKHGSYIGAFQRFDGRVFLPRLRRVRGCLRPR